MYALRHPFQIENAGMGRCRVTWTPIASEDGEQVTFTVAIRYQNDLTLTEAQRRALTQAAKLLQQAADALKPANP